MLHTRTQPVEINENMKILHDETLYHEVVVWLIRTAPRYIAEVSNDEILFGNPDPLSTRRAMIAPHENECNANVSELVGNVSRYERRLLQLIDTSSADEVGGVCFQVSDCVKGVHTHRRLILFINMCFVCTCRRSIRNVYLANVSKRTK